VLSTRNGSFLLLKPELVAISEQGLTTLTTYETATGKRAKFVRKLPAPTCKKDELDAVWRDPNAQVSARCEEYVTRNYGPPDRRRRGGRHQEPLDAAARAAARRARGGRLQEPRRAQGDPDAVVRRDRRLAARPAPLPPPPTAPAAAAAAASPSVGADKASSFAPAPAAEAAPPAAKKAKGKANAPKPGDPDAGGQ